MQYKLSCRAVGLLRRGCAPWIRFGRRDCEEARGGFVQGRDLRDFNRANPGRRCERTAVTQPVSRRLNARCGERALGGITYIGSRRG
jgi:hypothetical protein